MKIISITNLSLGYSATLPERSLYRGLVSRGVDLTVITHRKTPESQELEMSGIRVVYLQIRRKFDLKVISCLRRMIRDEKAEILHITFGKALTNGLLAARKTGCRIIAYIGSTSVYRHDPTAYLSFLNPGIDKLICLSDGVRQHLLKQGIKRLEGRTTRIYKGYEISWFRDIIPVTKESLKIPEDSPVVCCVANVRRLKGIPYLIRSVDFLPPSLQAHILLVGPGMDSPQIGKLIAATKRPGMFRTVGFTNDVLSFTALCDLYVQPSVTEGLGRSVIEAMCLGKPVIATGTGGVEELIEEGVTGFHLPAGNPEMLAEKISHCLGNPALLREMGTRGMERIETHFSSSRMIEETYQLFRSTVSLQ